MCRTSIVAQPGQNENGFLSKQRERALRNLMASFTSGSSLSRRMLSYVSRAFCSAARSSVRSAIMSPVTAMEPADHGKPDAAVG